MASAHAPTVLTVDALILAGGRSARLGGTAKSGVVVGQATLLDHALAAAAQIEAVRTVVVGPPGLVAPPVLCVQEVPAFGGPAAGVAAGLSALRADWVLLLACDLPRARDIGALLLAALHATLADADAGFVPHHAPADAPSGVPDGLCLRDGDGRVQWLAGIYRRQALVQAVADLGGADGLRGAPVGRLLGRLELLAIPDPAGVAADVDTWDEIDRARTDLTHPEREARP